MIQIKKYVLARGKCNIIYIIQPESAYPRCQKRQFFLLSLQKILVGSRNYKQLKRIDNS